MPELPEVETTLRGLKPLLLNHKLVKVDVRAKQLRFPFPPRFAKRLTGATVTALTRRAKYILLELDTGETLLIHLGMSGRLVRHEHGEPVLKHDHVILETEQGHQLRFHDPRRFGVMDIISPGDIKTHKLLAGIGPEPLGKELTPTYLQQKLAKKSANIKTILLDQRVIAGLGNIYVSEALFYAKINPQLAGSAVKPTKLPDLVVAIRRVLNASIKAGGTSMRDYVQATGEMGHFQQQFAVYGREEAPCLVCGTSIRRIVQAGRSTFYCPKCQK